MVSWYVFTDDSHYSFTSMILYQLQEFFIEYSTQCGSTIVIHIVLCHEQGYKGAATKTSAIVIF